MVLLGLTAIATTALLVSFTSKPDDDNKKKYQVIHHEGGKVVMHDTIISMTSNYSVDDFLADKGIDSKNVKIIDLPSLGKMMPQSGTHMIIRDLSEEVDGENTEKVEIQVEIDGQDHKTVKKIVNGEEVELTEEDLKMIEEHRVEGSHHSSMMKMRMYDDQGNHWAEDSENVQINVEIDDDGNRTITKIVNGEEVELTEEEMNSIEIHQMQRSDSENIMIILNEDDMGDPEDGKHVVVVKKTCTNIENSDDLDHNIEVSFEWISENSDGEVMMMNGDEDFTIVIVMEDYNENSRGKHRGKLSTSEDEVDVYPNPNDGTFTIRFSQSAKVKTTVKVTDSKGKIVFEKKLGKFKGDYNEQIDLKKFGSGTYIITIESGNNVEKTKVIVN